MSFLYTNVKSGIIKIKPRYIKNLRLSVNFICAIANNLFFIYLSQYLHNLTFTIFD